LLALNVKVQWRAWLAGRSVRLSRPWQGTRADFRRGQNRGLADSTQVLARADDHVNDTRPPR
jgi:hypothetical protein